MRRTLMVLGCLLVTTIALAGCVVEGPGYYGDWRWHHHHDRD